MAEVARSGEQDAGKLSLLDEIVNSAMKNNADALARGNLHGVSRFGTSDQERLNNAIDRSSNIPPQLAFYIMLPAGDTVHSFERALSIVRNGRISSILLSNLLVWVGNRKTTPAEATAAVALLLPMLKSGDAEAGDTAIQFVAYQINSLPPAEKLNVWAKCWHKAS